MSRVKSNNDRCNTKPWQKRRAMFAGMLPLPCWRCGVLIFPGEAWDLGHIIDRAHGGKDSDSWPEHRHRSDTCIGNVAAGAIVRRRKRDQPAMASRQW